MTYSASSFSAYYEQWLNIASKGNVTYGMAWATDRMRFHCKVCDQILVTKIPKDVEVIDYAVQQYVKLHRHESPDNLQFANPEWLAKPKAVTADFKPVVKRKDWGIVEGRKFR